jgi:hypothetical protein
VDERGKRIAIIVAVVMTAWFAFTVHWAFSSQTDSVPVGVDANFVPPRATAVEVSCNGPFDSAPRGSGPLPTLRAQPVQVPKVPPLAYQRTPCELVHHNARIVFALDVAAYLAVIGGGVAALTIARRRAAVANTVVAA